MNKITRLECEEINVGDVLQLNNGDHWLVLRVIFNTHVQNGFSSGWGIQKNSKTGKEKALIVWDGRFSNKRSIEEVYPRIKRVFHNTNPGFFQKFEDNYKI